MVKIVGMASTEQVQFELHPKGELHRCMQVQVQVQVQAQLSTACPKPKPDMSDSASERAGEGGGRRLPLSDSPSASPGMASGGTCSRGGST